MTPATSKESAKLLKLADELSRQLEDLSFGAPVTHVYNPFQYARPMVKDYYRKYGDGKGRVLLLGMNPGPWGMAQTGVPFGEVALVRDWLKIAGKISQPEDMHPARPVMGLECHRSEVSGARLWGWAKERFATPEKFFERFFVVNYCPLLFLAAKEKSVANVTPDRLRKEERDAVLAACDWHLAEKLDVLRPSQCLGVGAFAQKCLKRVSKEHDLELDVASILHPSPASPIANRGWAPQAEKQLRDLGIKLP